MMHRQQKKLNQPIRSLSLFGYSGCHLRGYVELLISLTPEVKTAYGIYFSINYAPNTTLSTTLPAAAPFRFMAFHRQNHKFLTYTALPAPSHDQKLVIHLKAIEFNKRNRHTRKNHKNCQTGNNKNKKKLTVALNHKCSTTVRLFLPLFKAQLCS